MVISHHKQSKLKPLLDDLPPGFLVETAWLVARKIDRKSIHDYVKRGWLQRATRGVYRRPFIGSNGTSAKIDWQVTVLSMQHIMEYDVHVGGKSALTISGNVHYLDLADTQTVYLYSDAFPSWLDRLPAMDIFEKRSLALFGRQPTGIENLRVAPGLNVASTPAELSPWRWPLTLSSPERAILEMINELPQKESFEVVDKVFEGLSGLRPRLIGEVLNECRSIKVKRLFFVFADRHNHAWRKYVSPNKHDLGSGPRALVKGGRIHPTYRIYVPSDFVTSAEVRNSND